MLTSDLTVNMSTYTVKRTRLLFCHPRHFIHSFAGNEHIWDRTLRWRGGCDVIQSVICLRCFIRPSVDRLFIDYILCFHFFLSFLKIIFSRQERKKERNRSKNSAIKRYLILMHCFHADKLSFTCSSGS